MKWQNKNRAHRNTYSAVWRAAHPEMVAAKYQRAKINNPHQWRIREHNKRAKKRENGGKLSQGLAEKLFKLQKGKCPCCGRPLGDNYHMDHRIPISLGGKNEDSNMQLLRRTCNQQKHAKDPVQFMQERGFLL